MTLTARCNLALRPGVRVTLEDSSREIGTVIAVHGEQVKVLWPRYISRWHDVETLKPTGFQRKENKQ